MKVIPLTEKRGLIPPEPDVPLILDSSDRETVLDPYGNNCPSGPESC